MEKSVEYALKNSPVLQGQEIALLKADEFIKSERGYFLPSVSASYGYNDINSISSTGLTDTDYVDQISKIGSVKLTQTLFSGFEYINRYERAKLGKEHAQASLEVKKLDLIYQVQITFLGLMKKQHDIVTLAKSVERLETDFKSAQAFSEHELVPYSYVLQVEADLEFSKQQLWEAQTLVDKYRSHLNLLLGIPRDADMKISYQGSFDKTDFDLEKNMEVYIDRALKTRQEPTIIALAIGVAQKDAKIALGKYYPKVRISANFNDVDKDYGTEGVLSNGQTYDRDQRNTYWAAGIFVDWSLFDGGTQYFNKQKNLLEIRKLKKDLEQVSMEISTEVMDSYKALVAAKKRFGSAQKAFGAAKENYAMEQKRFQARVTTMSELLLSNSKLIRSDASLGQTMLDYQIAIIELNHAMGMAYKKSVQ